MKSYHVFAVNISSLFPVLLYVSPFTGLLGVAATAILRRCYSSRQAQESMHGA